MSPNRSITRRQALKLGAGASTALLASGCRTLLDQINVLAPTLTPSATPSLPDAIATIPPSPVSPIPTPTPIVSPLEPVSMAAPNPSTANAVPRPQLIAPAGGSKIGLHATFGPRNGLDEFLAQCAQSGHPVAVVKCVDDFEPAFKAKQHSDQTLTVGRINAVRRSNKDFVDMQAWEPSEYQPPPGVNYTTAQEAAQQYYNLVKPTWELNPVIDVWETFNEFSWHWGWQADFYIALMDLAEADGYRLGLWSPSAGNPPEEFYPDIARACQRAKAHGGHILCLHEYGLAGLLKDAPRKLVTRYRQLYQYLQQVDAVIPLVISEAGENAGGGFTGVIVFIEDFAWYDAQLSQDDYVIGCAAWTLGDWNEANFEAALPVLADYISGQPISWSQAYLPLVEKDQIK